MRGPLWTARAYSLSCALLAALAAGGCSERPVAVTEDDADLAVTLRVGQQLFVTLGSNPSTGFVWACEMSPEGHLSLDASGYEPRDEGSGAGGWDRFRFTARRSGRTTLSFVSRRAPAPPVSTIHYVVLVE